MARERRRLLVAPQRLQAAADGCLALTAEESRYLTRVLRYGPGDGFALIDGQGRLWGARLEAADRARLEQPLQQPLQQQSAPTPSLVLAAAVVKRDFELVVRMAVELGVDRLVPLVCERTAVLGQLKAERWRSIAAEAAEQCERLWLPEIAEPTPVAALLACAAGRRYWATTRADGLPELVQRLADGWTDGWTEQAGSSGSADGDALWLACGPEGGWSPAEEQGAVAAGWEPIGLGPRILRSSTACIAGLALLSSWRARRCGC
jgi:16S rRNA (uracil1498-N3)-methyltransferase